MLTSLPAKAAPFINVRDGLTLAQAIVDTVRDPLVVLDQNLRVIAASRSFFQTFRLVSDHAVVSITNCIRAGGSSCTGALR